VANLVNKDSPVNLAQILTKLERAYIQDALRESKGNKVEAARLLSLKRSTLSEKVRRMGIDLGHI